jgi:hypothetical protein
MASRFLAANGYSGNDIVISDSDTEGAAAGAAAAAVAGGSGPGRPRQQQQQWQQGFDEQPDHQQEQQQQQYGAFRSASAPKPAAAEGGFQTARQMQQAGGSGAAASGGSRGAKLSRLKTASGAAAAAGRGSRRQTSGIADQGDDFSLADVMEGAGFSTAAAGAGPCMTAGVNPLSRKGLSGSLAAKQQQQQQTPSLGFVSAASLTKAAADSTAGSADGAAAAVGGFDSCTGGWRVKQPTSKGAAAVRTQAGLSSGSKPAAGSSKMVAGHGMMIGSRKDPAAALAQELKAVDDSDDDFI